MWTVTRAVFLMACKREVQVLLKDLEQMQKYKVFVKFFWSNNRVFINLYYFCKITELLVISF